ncbi:kinesin, partial [Helicosporidium sp. ATCC 50920]
SSALAVSGQRTAVLSDPARAGDAVVRTYDRVLGPEESQASLFAAVGEPVVEHCMAGFNSSIFAYGQTGAGKTHSMLGRVARRRDGSLDEGCGIALRVFDRLFQRIREVESDSLRFSVKCSFLEIYNEDISDLLVGWADGKGADKRAEPRPRSPSQSPGNDEASSPSDERASS